MKKFYIDKYLYDFYIIPTIHIYSRRKDTFIFEITWLKFYAGFEKK